MPRGGGYQRGSAKGGFAIGGFARPNPPFGKPPPLLVSESLKLLLQGKLISLAGWRRLFLIPGLLNILDIKDDGPNIVIDISVIIRIIMFLIRTINILNIVIAIVIIIAIVIVIAFGMIIVIST